MICASGTSIWAYYSNVSIACVLIGGILFCGVLTPGVTLVAGVTLIAGVAGVTLIAGVLIAGVLIGGMWLDVCELSLRNAKTRFPLPNPDFVEVRAMQSNSVKSSQLDFFE